MHRLTHPYTVHRGRNIHAPPHPHSGVLSAGFTHSSQYARTHTISADQETVGEQNSIPSASGMSRSPGFLYTQRLPKHT